MKTRPDLLELRRRRRRLRRWGSVSRSIGALLIVAVQGCATTTELVTATPGARVVRESDQRELGVTPYKHTTTMWAWQSEKLTIVPKRGPKKTIELWRTEVDLLPMAGGTCLTGTIVGCVVGIPLILAGGMKLPETTNVDDEKPQPVSAKKGTRSASRQRY